MKELEEISQYKRCRVVDVYIVFQNGHIERFHGDNYFIAVDDFGHFHIEEIPKSKSNTRKIIRYSFAFEIYIQMVRDDKTILEEEEIKIKQFVRPSHTFYLAYDTDGTPLYTPISELLAPVRIEDDDLPF